jgi:hypothetical protein
LRVLVKVAVTGVCVRVCLLADEDDGGMRESAMEGVFMSLGRRVEWPTGGVVVEEMHHGP